MTHRIRLVRCLIQSCFLSENERRQRNETRRREEKKKRRGHGDDDARTRDTGGDRGGGRDVHGWCVRAGIHCRGKKENGSGKRRCGEMWPWNDCFGVCVCGGENARACVWAFRRGRARDGVRGAGRGGGKGEMRRRRDIHGQETPY